MQIKLPLYARIIIILIGLTFIVQILIAGKTILAPFLLSVFLTFLVLPVCKRLEKIKIPRFIAALVSVLFVGAFIAGIVFFFVNQLLGFADELPELREQLKEKSERFAEPIEEILDFDAYQPDAAGLTSFLQENITVITTGVIDAASNITVIFMIPIYMILLLVYRDFFNDFLLKAFYKEDDPDEFQALLKKIRGVIFNYITGMFFVMIILFILNSVALISLGVKHAFLFAAFAALLNVIPFVGPLIGSLIPITYAFITADSLWIPFGVFLSFYIIQVMESNIFTPGIVGGKVSMNPLITILTIFTGAMIWGFVGMILFIPLLAIIKIIFDQIEPLQPYGFLLGSPEGSKMKKGHTIQQRIKSWFSGNKKD